MPEKTGFLTRDSILENCRGPKPLIEFEPEDGNRTTLMKAGDGKYPDGLESWSYDMRLGHEVFLSSEKKVRNLENNEAFFIQAGDFALLTTHEKVHIPLDLVAFITLRFRLALKGLINVSGFHVDPGYHAPIFFSVYNAGPNPVAVRQGDRIFMIVFAHLDGEVPDLDPREKAEFNNPQRLKSEWIAAAKGPTVNLLKLNREVERLRAQVEILIGVLGATAVTIVGALAVSGRL